MLIVSDCSIRVCLMLSVIDLYNTQNYIGIIGVNILY